MLRAAIFDLDDTLLDTSALSDARERREWDAVLGGLESVGAFEVAEGETAVASLPSEARARGLGVGLFTHSPQSYAEQLLDSFDIRVDEMVSGSDRLPLKPDPTGLLTIARSLGVDPAECIYVGDSVGDFGAAAGAGMASVGVSWQARTPESWRHGWPDVAVARPGRILSLLDGARNLGPVAEVMAEGLEPVLHWGSLVRLGSATYGLGRYFPMEDRRYPGHALSHLILDSKTDAEARGRLGGVFAVLERAKIRNPPGLIVSVPPDPEGEDRFEAAREQLADSYGARDGGGVLRQLYGVDEYKFTPRKARAGKVVNRFEATERLEGEKVILIDDVITSGAQAQACRAALKEAGAGAVTIVAAAITQDSLPEPCPSCGEEYGGTIRTKRRRDNGEEFLGCSRWRNGCRWSQDL